MTQIKELLTMIETVDPSDTAKLDEIDREVYFFIEQPDQEKNMRKGYVWTPSAPKYTRSRDALKAIRPKGWDIDICWIDGKVVCQITHRENPFDGAYNYTSGKRPTEELAELHAILQAIDYERTHND